MDGYALAERLGLEAWHDMPGDDGSALFLEDGRVLKVTSSKVEAAVALALMDAAAAGRTHPAVPLVHDVRWTVEEVDLRDLGIGEGLVEVTRYAVVRDGFDDLDGGGEAAALWAYALRHLCYGWVQRRPEHVAEALDAWAPHGDALRQVLDGLEWIARETGARIADIRPSNVGVGPSGAVGMRDLGRAEVPRPLLDRVEARRFAAVPEPPAAPGVRP